MGQDEIIKYLKKKKASERNPVDIHELLANIPKNRKSISANCHRLRKRNEIKYIKKKEGSYEKFLYFL